MFLFYTQFFQLYLYILLCNLCGFFFTFTHLLHFGYFLKLLIGETWLYTLDFIDFLNSILIYL